MSRKMKTAVARAGLAAAVLLALGGVFSKAWRLAGDGEPRVWFYDQSKQRLYAAPGDIISPDGKFDTRVRAMVIGFRGMGNDPENLRIAYLEKYSPDFKALLERANAAHRHRRPFTEKIPAPGSPYARENTFVKRPEEASWHSLGTAEARQILSQWRQWHGPAGEAPVISTPAAQ
jgi:hypothetical protein